MPLTLIIPIKGLFAFCCPHHISTSIAKVVEVKTIKNLYCSRKKHVCCIVIVIKSSFPINCYYHNHAMKKNCPYTQFVQKESTTMTSKPMCECHLSTKQCGLTWRVIFIEVRKLIYYHPYNYVQYKIILKRSCQKEKNKFIDILLKLFKIRLPTWEILFIVLTPTSNSGNLHFFLLQMPYPKVSFTIKYTQNSETIFCENMKLAWT
jgi:hypothetical protein